MSGKVWLVGAGPGDVGLFTLKGLKVLKNAEVVFYDSLVGQGVLSQIPASARLVNVGNVLAITQCRRKKLIVCSWKKQKKVIVWCG